MGRILTNKYFAGGFVFAFFCWLSYATLQGGDLTDRTRGGVHGIEQLLMGLVARTGTTLGAVIVLVIGAGLSFYAYKRAERLSQAS